MSQAAEYGNNNNVSSNSLKHTRSQLHFHFYVYLSIVAYSTAFYLARTRLKVSNKKSSVFVQL